MAIFRYPHKWHAVLVGVAAPLLVVLAACNASASVPTAPPAPTSAPPNEQTAQGQRKFIAVGCAACHGDRGEGGIGPRSSGTTMALEDLQRLVRSGAMDGARYTDDELTDQDIATMYRWLQTNPAG